MDNLVVSFMFLINMVFQFFVSFVFWVCGMLDCCRITSRLSSSEINVEFHLLPLSLWLVRGAL